VRGRKKVKKEVKVEMTIPEMTRLDAAVEIKVNEFAWKGNLSQIVRIDGDNLTGELTRQPELVSWFGVVEVEANDAVEKAKNELAVLKDAQEILYAHLDLEVREQHRANKPTESAIKSMILTNPRYLEHADKIGAKREELRSAGVICGKISKILTGLKHKLDMLIQLSCNYRKEHGSGDYGHDGPL